LTSPEIKKSILVITNLNVNVDPAEDWIFYI